MASIWTRHHTAARALGRHGTAAGGTAAARAPRYGVLNKIR